MLFKKSILVVLLFLISASNQEPILKTNDFIIECTDITKYQKIFDNNCYFSPDNFYGNLVSLVQFIDESDSQLKIDELLRSLFVNITKYFENKYYNNTYYMDTLDGLLFHYIYAAKIVIF